MAANPPRLLPAALRARCDPTTLPFQTTEELAPSDGMIGQTRALDATTFGIAMRGTGYNLFVVGAPATGKASTMRRILGARARREPTPPDHCYVHNFTDPYRPTALALPPGDGRKLRDEMSQLVEECRTRLPRAFESEDFERQKTRLVQDVAEHQQAEIQRLAAAARAVRLALVQTPQGFTLVPAPSGTPLGPEEFAALPETVRTEIAAAGKTLEERLQATARELRRLEREGRARHQQLVHDTGAAATHHLIQELREAFAGLAPVQRYLDDVERDLIAHAEDFRRLAEHEPVSPFQPPVGAFLDRYQVNVLVDRSGAEGAPLVFEQNPTHGNLVGHFEHRVHFGTLVTDFTLIKPGALHRANGGYLVLEAKEVLRHPLAWEALKKTLKSKAVRIEEPLEEFRLASAAGLAPEPIPVSLKVVLLTTPLLYALLYGLDEDVRELFKVKADFDDSLARGTETELLYARFVAGACRDEGLRHFTADGVAHLIEHASRMVSHQERMTARLGKILEVIREAAFWADQRGHALVAADDVRHAIAQKIYRANLVEERVARALAEGTLLVAADAEAVGQVNGIAVTALGDHAFGRPSRITARVFSGKPGVIDIEREAKLGGAIHSKGVLILTGYLAGHYARDRPLALAASIAFEQQYDEIDGDSASVAELVALLSSLTQIPVTQALAITGSLNQRGEIQPVGGINEKIEGFFDLCRSRGLTGRQGVLIPRTNVRHLMLREDVVDAVARGEFVLHPIATVDEALALASGRVAGARDAAGRFPDGSFNAAVEQALEASVSRLRQLRAD